MTKPVRTVRVDAEEIEIPAKSVARYLGLGKSSPDEALFSLIGACIPEFRRAARFAACYLELPVSISENGVDFGAFFAPGKSLGKHMTGCDRAIVFAATAGMETELQRKRAAVLSPARALVLDAVGTAAIESFCDRLCALWAGESPARRLRPRFSPGYGDLPLDVQGPLLALLDAGRNAGIALTQALLMLPQKSVSAIVGAATEFDKENSENERA